MVNQRYQHGPSGQTTQGHRLVNQNYDNSSNCLPQHIINKNSSSSFSVDSCNDSLNIQNGKHYKEKLSCIREDLKPFEQQQQQQQQQQQSSNYSITNYTTTSYQSPHSNLQYSNFIRSNNIPQQRPSPPSSTLAYGENSSNNNNNNNNNRDTKQNMLNYLISMGYNEVDAKCALKLVKYSSVTAAVNLLISINKKNNETSNNNGMIYNNNIQKSNNNHTSIINVASSGKNYPPPPPPTTSNQQITINSTSTTTTYPVNEDIINSGTSTTTNIGSNNNEIFQEFKRIPQQHYQISLPYHYQQSNDCVEKQQTTSSHHHIEIPKTTNQRSSGTVISIDQQSDRIKQSLTNGISLPLYKTTYDSNETSRKINSSSSRHLPNSTNSINIDPTTNNYTNIIQGNSRNINLLKMHQQTSFGNNIQTSLCKQTSTNSSSGNSNRNSPLLNSSNGIQSIIVDPDSPQDLEKELDKICKGVTRLPSINNSSFDVQSSSSNGNEELYYHQQERKKSNGSNNMFERNCNKRKVIRCISPLPETVTDRIRNNNFESNIRHCKPGMFRFFMEQHIEKLIQQYKERNQRAIQLMSEMEQAELPERLKEQLLKFLHQKESKYIRLKRQRMDVSMFDILKHIGVGAFGKVSLVKKKDTGQVYAMKTLIKTEVIQKQQAAHVKAERDILAEANSPWIVKLFFSFQDTFNLYFIMEYVPGGDMMQLLINKGIFSEKLARFYIAELVCAIEYVHNLGFIHRDIKPDNILIDKLGHIKLTDFGLCTGLRWTHDKRHYVIAENDNGEIPDHMRSDSFFIPTNGDSKEPMKVLEQRNAKKRNQAHSVVGTSNYMAPEVILKIGHTKACDWWSVGVILYEMVLGRPPFMSQREDAKETQFKIVNWKHYLVLNDHTGKLSKGCLGMIRNLCKDQNDRLGRNGANEIKQDQWFYDIDFNTLRSNKAEWIPKVDHAEDTSNFDDIKFEDDIFGGDLPPQFVNNPAFYEFTYRHFFDLEGQGGGKQYHPHKRAPLSNIEGMSSMKSIQETLIGNNDKKLINSMKETSKSSYNFSRKTTSFPPTKDNQPNITNMNENHGKVINGGIVNTFQQSKNLSNNNNSGNRLNGFHLLKHYQKYKLSSAIRTPSMTRRDNNDDGNDIIKEDSYESDSSELVV